MGPGLASALCSFLWNALEGAGMQLLTLGIVPRGPHEATLGTAEIEMVVSIRQPCALSAPLGDFGGLCLTKSTKDDFQGTVTG